jgi:hypothetical protein
METLPLIDDGSTAADVPYDAERGSRRHPQNSDLCGTSREQIRVSSAEDSSAGRDVCDGEDEVADERGSVGHGNELAEAGARLVSGQSAQRHGVDKGGCRHSNETENGTDIQRDEDRGLGHAGNDDEKPRVSPPPFAAPKERLVRLGSDLDGPSLMRDRQEQERC